MSTLPRRLAWWAADYAFAAVWQVRALLPRPRADRFRSGELDPVVLIPGIWETWGFLRPLADELHRAGHPVYFVPGLGINSGPVDRSAAIVYDVVERNDLRNVLLICHSKGGLIGKYAMTYLDKTQRLSRMIAVSTPFSGSSYARYLVLPSLRALAPGEKMTVLLAGRRDVNERITSVYGEFDPHIPEGSELPGARNVRLATGGHFRVLGLPRTREILLGA